MFTHLHVHTEYSLLDGMCRIPQLLARAKELGMDSLAITDHGVMYGVIEFYQAAKAAGIKPIIGCEVYVAKGSHTSRATGEKGHYHLVLLAKDLTGYQNLIQLTTRAHLDGFYYRPRVDRQLLEQHRKGLVALSACTGGEIPQLILGGRLPEAADAARWHKETFEDYYFELQPHPIPEVQATNRGLVELGAQLGIPLVATNDTHYINRIDASAHDLLLCIGTNASVNDEKRMRMAGDFFYLKSPAEMIELFRDLPQALENTAGIAEKCDLKLEFGRLHLPEVELPPGKTPDQFLSELCHDNLSRYYPNPGDEIKQRLDYELDVIQKTQFANYFLVVWDIISFVRKQGILVGVRGSAAASIVLHCLGITDVDPIKNRLVFERFLNIERREMPDIDLDFQDDRREEVIAYVSKKYGQDHVAQIITFGTLGAKAAVRDVGRALGMTYGEVDRVARLVPSALGMTLERALKENPELSAIYNQDEIVRKLVDSARRVEGTSRHASTHAAGVVIAKEPLTRYVPLQRGSSRTGSQEAVMTQFTMGDIARIGLLKMDFLGLANLTILGKARELIRQDLGKDIDLHHLPLTDKKTFDLLSSGETVGVFQLESSGMRRYIKQLKPNTFGDIAAMVALYRPGPMEHIPEFIENKTKHKKITYIHPALESILKETYGVIVYQEQVLFIVQALAGYSLGQADIFRKAMGKKIAEVMQKEKKHFFDGAAAKGFSPEVASQVFTLIEPFAGYAFNKAHAFSYALVAYQTAYLKANYPVQYMTALLIASEGNLEKTATAVAECYRVGLKVLPPDINRSQASFTTEKSADGGRGIRFGLAAIKNVGLGAVEPIIAERERGGPFKSMEDLSRRCPLDTVNRRVMESLVKAGAFDSLGKRGSLLENVSRILGMAQREQKLRDTGQSTMFDLFGQSVPVPAPQPEAEPDDVTVKEHPTWEKELMGVAFSEKPFNPTAGSVTNLCGQIDEELEGQTVVVAGRVVSCRELITKAGAPFASAILADISGQIEVMVWPKTYAGTRDLWQAGNEIEVEGKVRIKDEKPQLGCDQARRYEPNAIRNEEPVKAAVPISQPPSVEAPPPSLSTSSPSAARRLLISLDQSEDGAKDEARLFDLDNILRAFPGRDEVRLNISDEGEVKTFRLRRTNCCPELQQRLGGLIGERSFRVESNGH